MALSDTCLWASLDALKPWLKLSPAADVSDDVVLTQLAESVTEEFERLTGRVWVSRAISETLHGSGTRLLTLRAYPVASPLTTFTQDGTAVDASTYVLDAAGGLIWRTSGVWTAGIGNFAVGYTAGYARASLPASVLQLAAEMLRWRYTDWTANADHVSTLTAYGSQYIPRSSWPYHVKDGIDALRYEHRIVVG